MRDSDVCDISGRRHRTRCRRRPRGRGPCRRTPRRPRPDSRGANAGPTASWVHETAPEYLVSRHRADGKPGTLGDGRAGVARLQRAVHAACALALRGRHNRAARVLARCVASLAARGATSEAASASCALGELLLDRAQPDRAAAAFARARGLASGGATGLRVLIGTGRAALEQARFNDAEAVFRTAALTDDSGDARLWLARTLCLRGQLDAAEAVLGDRAPALRSEIRRLTGDFAGAAHAAGVAVREADERDDPSAICEARLAAARVQAAARGRRPGALPPPPGARRRSPRASSGRQDPGRRRRDGLPRGLRRPRAGRCQGPPDPRGPGSVAVGGGARAARAGRARCRRHRRAAGSAGTRPDSALSDAARCGARHARRRCGPSGRRRRPAPVPRRLLGRDPVGPAGPASRRGGPILAGRVRPDPTGGRRGRQRLHPGVAPEAARTGPDRRQRDWRGRSPVGGRRESAAGAYRRSPAPGGNRVGAPAARAEPGGRPRRA